MMSNGFVKVFVNECKILLKSPKRIFYTLLFPMLLFTFLGSLFYNGVPRDLPVAYIDYSQTQLSHKLVQMLDASPAIKMDRIVLDQKQAKSLIQKGEVYGFILIPEDFQDKIYQGLSSSAICYTNNQYLLPSGLIQKYFQHVVGTFSAGIKIKRETQANIQVNRAYAEVQPVLTDVHTLFNPFSNYAYYLLIILFPMLLQMIVMMVTVYVIGSEFKYKTVTKWFLISGENSFAAFWGKILPYTLVLFFLGWWMNYFLFVRIGAPLRVGMLNVVLMTWLLIVIYQFLGVAVASIAKDLRGALTIGSGFTALALSFAAYTFPVEGLPKSIQYLAKIFPFSHFMNYFVKRAVKGIPISFSWYPLVAIVFFLLLFILAYPKFVNRLKTGGYEETF